MRRNVRQRHCAPIMVIWGSARVLAQIDDVSQGGLRVRAALAATSGDVVQLHGLGARVAARVIWCDRGLLGLEFVGDPMAGELRRFIAALLRAPLPRRGARMHGFTELAAPRPALPDAPPRPAARRPARPRTG